MSRYRCGKVITDDRFIVEKHTVAAAAAMMPYGTTRWRLEKRMDRADTAMISFHTDILIYQVISPL